MIRWTFRGKFCGVDWIDLAQVRYRWRALVDAVMNILVPQNAAKLSSGCTTCGPSSGTQLHRVSYYYYPLSMHMWTLSVIFATKSAHFRSSAMHATCFAQSVLLLK
jgi:hypothetical protein